jgi:hypothetical protein
MERNGNFSTKFEFLLFLFFVNILMNNNIYETRSISADSPYNTFTTKWLFLPCRIGLRCLNSILKKRKTSVVVSILVQHYSDRIGIEMTEGQQSFTVSEMTEMTGTVIGTVIGTV